MFSRSLFTPRINYKPFEYPEAIELMEKLNHTYWLHSELTFNADKQDYHNLQYFEKEAVRRSLCAVATIECSLKTFWVQLGNHFPKPEFSMLGITAGESEIRHAESYSRLLTLLDLEQDFTDCLHIPAIKGRFEYLEKYLKLSPHNSDNKKYVLKLILFSVLIENVSLFSQFASIMYFYRHKGIMKDIRNIIKWTSIDEQLHFNIGLTIVNILRTENPELFDQDLAETVRKACIKSVKYEGDILNWIFENGELDNLSKEDLLNYMKHRVNESMISMRFEKPFSHVGDLKNTDFFFEEVFADSQDDFFAVRPVDYTLSDKPITRDELF